MTFKHLREPGQRKARCDRMQAMRLAGATLRQIGTAEGISYERGAAGITQALKRQAVTNVPPLPCTAAPGSEDWARWMLLNTFTDDADRRAITDIVATGLVPRPSLWRARTHYALTCHDRRWAGWQARLVWAIIEALLKDPCPSPPRPAGALDEDIPF